MPTVRRQFTITDATVISLSVKDRSAKTWAVCFLLSTFSAGAFAMFRWTAMFTLLLLVPSQTAFTQNPTAPAEANAVTFDALQGTWKEVHLIDSGEKSTARSTFEFAKQQLKIVEGGRTLEFSIKLDTSKKPVHLDLSLKAAEGTLIPLGGTALAICEFRGKQLILCMMQPGGPRPAEFESKRDDNRRLITLERMDK